MKLRFKRLVALAPAMLFACAPAAASTIEVMKAASCGCCAEWVDHLREEGFTVKVDDVEDPGVVSKAMGVPDNLRSCHVAKVARYAVEGHVPAADIKRLLSQKPKAIGIAVAGMPMGSPGMDQGSAKQAYNTVIFEKDGKQKVFAHH